MTRSQPRSSRLLKPKRTVSIIGTGCYVPERILTNAELEKMVDTSDEWIVTRTGIRERRIAAKGEYTSDMAAHAARRAIEQAGIEPEEIDLIIVATVTPDMFFPSTACFVQQKIGAKRAACFDVSAACSGFLYAIEIAQQFITSSTYNTVLVIGADKLSSIVDWTDRNTCVLFGDGAGAAVLRNRAGSHGVVHMYMGSDGSLTDVLYMPGGGCRLPRLAGDACAKAQHHQDERQGDLQVRRHRAAHRGQRGSRGRRALPRTILRASSRTRPISASSRPWPIA